MRRQTTAKELQIVRDSARLAIMIGHRHVTIDPEVLIRIIDPAWDRPRVGLEVPCSSRYRAVSLLDEASA